MTAADRSANAPRGVLVVDKPSGMTSHDVVDEIRRRFHTRKVGHAGTLDPDATGVLVIGIGAATRLLEYAQRERKRYIARATFGTTTTTQDAAGEVLETRPVTFGRDDLDRALAGLVGELEQVPPMVSAVKIGGERLYKKARRGEDVERPARHVTVYSLRLAEFDATDGMASLEVQCSAGTYIRTLVHDLGQRLGSGAHLSALRRTASGGFTEEDAVPLDAVAETHLRPVAEIVRSLPRLDLDDDQARAVTHGRALERPGGLASAADAVALYAGGDLVAVYKTRGDRLVADKVLAS